MRGVVGQSLTPKLLTRFAQAFGTHTGSGTIVIGRDPRTSGEMVKHAVVAGILSTGSRVIDIGVCPVPTVQLQVRHRRAQGGIAITASHNPAEWNALKFIGSNGLFLDAGQARELLDIYHQGQYTKVGGAEIRTVEEVEGATDLHIKSILDVLGPLPKTPKKLRVVLDSCNGAGSLVGPKLIEALGAEVIPINVTPDGSFPRPAEPLAGKPRRSLPRSQRASRRHRLRAGHGCGSPGDCFRSRVKPIGEDYTLVLAMLYVLGREKGAGRCESVHDFRGRRRREEVRLSGVSDEDW